MSKPRSAARVGAGDGQQAIPSDNKPNPATRPSASPAADSSAANNSLTNKAGVMINVMPVTPSIIAATASNILLIMSSATAAVLVSLCLEFRIVAMALCRGAPTISNYASTERGGYRQNQSSIAAATSSTSSTVFLSAALRFEGFVSMVTLMILPVN